VENIDKETIARLVNEVKRTLGSSVIALGNCECKRENLPFYSRFSLYTVFDMGVTPITVYRLLDNGIDTILLDGTISAWQRANEIEHPKIDLGNMFDYCRTVLANQVELNGRILLFSSFDDIEFDILPTKELLEMVENCIIPPVLRKSSNTITLFCTVAQSNKIFSSEIAVSSNGDIKIVKMLEVLNEVPIASFEFGASA